MMGAIRVLLVDDEEDLAFTIEERLRLRGIDADAIVSGHGALKQFRQKQYDVVVLDIKMPGVGGLEVMSALRREHPDVPVILFTGHSASDVQAEAFDFLVKPIDIDTLVDKIKAAAASRQGQSAHE